MDNRLPVNPDMTFPNVINQRLVNPAPNPSYHDTNIAANQANKVGGTIQRRLVIDSTKRDLRNYPNPNNYHIPWTYEYKDVVDVELVQGIIPVGDYVVNESNNKLIFQEEDGVPITLTIPEGDYVNGGNEPSFDLLATEIESQMNSASSGSTYTVSYLSNTQTFSITSDLSGGYFGLNFYCDPLDEESRNRLNTFQIERQYKEINYPEGSIAQLLGYNPYNYNYGQGAVILNSGSTTIIGVNTNFLSDYQVGDYIRFVDDPNRYQVVSVLSNNQMVIDAAPLNDGQYLYYYHTHVGTNRADFFYFRYIVLNIEQLERNESNLSPVIDSYTVIPVGPRDFRNVVRINLSRLPRDCETKFFNPPLGKLKEFRIRFTYPNGALYNFRGLNHMLDFKISCLNQPGKYLIGSCFNGV